MPKKQIVMIAPQIRSNLQIVRSILNHSNLHISQSTSSICNADHDNDSQLTPYFQQIDYLLAHLCNPIKSMSTFIRLVDSVDDVEGLAYQICWIFQDTLFPQCLHPLFTVYLRKKTAYYRMDQQAQKIIDIFYKFMYFQHPDLMQKNLKKGGIASIGKWFYEQGISRLFNRYHSTKQEFTKLVGAFMQYGIVVLFIAAADILAEKPVSLQINATNIEGLKIAYIDKYGLN